MLYYIYIQRPCQTKKDIFLPFFLSYIWFNRTTYNWYAHFWKSDKGIKDLVRWGLPSEFVPCQLILRTCWIPRLSLVRKKDAGMLGAQKFNDQDLQRRGFPQTLRNITKQDHHCHQLNHLWPKHRTGDLILDKALPHTAKRIHQKLQTWDENWTEIERNFTPNDPRSFYEHQSLEFFRR